MAMRVGQNGSMELNQDTIYEVVWPRSPRGVGPRRLTDRLENLNGKRVAFLWDYLFRGDELVPMIERELTSRFPGLAVVGYEEFGNSHGGDEADFVARLPKALAEREIDAVVSGIGC